MPLLGLCHAKAWDERFTALATHLRCLRCGRKKPKVSAVNTVPHDPPIGLQSQAEYQAAVKKERR